MRSKRSPPSRDHAHMAMGVSLPSKRAASPSSAPRRHGAMGGVSGSSSPSAASTSVTVLLPAPFSPRITVARGCSGMVVVMGPKQRALRIVSAVSARREDIRHVFARARPRVERCVSGPTAMVSCDRYAHDRLSSSPTCGRGARGSGGEGRHPPRDLRGGNRGGGRAQRITAKADDPNAGHTLGKRKKSSLAELPGGSC